MRLTVKHHYFFGKKAQDVGNNLLQPTSWDKIRLDGDESTPFSIPQDRNNWLKKAKGHALMAQRGKAISDFLKRNKEYKKIYSFGIGQGFMECNLKLNYPEIFLVCSDFAPKAVERLEKVFLEANRVEIFNMLEDNWKNYGPDALYVFHRLDADFSDRQWGDIFKKMSQSGIENILFVPCDISSIKFLIRETIGYFHQLTMGRKMSFAGYLRTKDQFHYLLGKYYDIIGEFPVHDLTGFLLKIKRGG